MDRRKPKGTYGAVAGRGLDAPVLPDRLHISRMPIIGLGDSGPVEEPPR